MKGKYNPWEVVEELYKDVYTKEQVDEMLMCEITELIENHKYLENIYQG